MSRLVFISYNRDDEKQVTRLKRVLVGPLEACGFKPWFDQDEIRGGTDWMLPVNQALRESVAVLVCIGPSGPGEWQLSEAQQAEIEHKKRSIPVIPLLLPQASDVNKVFSNFPFLELKQWIDFRKGIADDVSQDEEFKKLLWSITGTRSSVQVNSGQQAVSKPEALPPKASPEAVSRAVDQLHPYLSDGKLTFFVGAGVSPAPVDDPPLEKPRVGPVFRLLSRALCEELKLVGSEADGILPGLDTASEFYIAKNTLAALVNAIQKQLPKALGGIPPAYEQLALLLALLTSRKVLRGNDRPLHLVVSTNFDSLLECALLLSGVKFTRIVQYWKGDALQIDQYTPAAWISSLDMSMPEMVTNLRKRVGEARNHVTTDAANWLRDQRVQGSSRKVDLVTVRGGNGPSLDKLGIRFDAPSVSGGPQEPILYKLYGSLDIPSSCAISAAQQLHLLAEDRQFQIIPEQIRDAVAQTAVVFLGYWPLDPDLRLLFNILREQLQSVYEKRIVVPFWPPGREETMRQVLRERTPPPIGMPVLDEDSETFLEQLIQRVAEGL